MEFHDRVGAQEASWPESQQRRAMWTGMSQTTFMSRVLPYFGGGLVLTAIGTAFAKNAGTGMLIVAVVLNFVLYFALMWNRHTPGLNVALFYGYTFVNGLMLGPLVALANMINPWLVVQALGLTAVGFFAIATYVMTTGKDFSGLGPFLIAGLLVVIVAGLLNLFVGGAGLGLGISILSAVLFMGFTAYDMSNIMLKFRDEEYILATVELYLDFINLFVALLRILIHIAASNRD
ncbi:MAG TPA: Bax inhibitor-1 family protein [Candidatus Ozemobacteraceae bacterium]